MAARKTPDPSVVLAPVPPGKVEALWHALAPFIEKVPRMGERFTLEDVKAWLLETKLQAWGLVESETGRLLAVFCTEVCVWPTGLRVLRIPFVAGEEIERWIGHLGAFEEQMWAEGVDEIELAGRPGWARVTGYDERSRTLVKVRPDHG